MCVCVCPSNLGNTSGDQLRYVVALFPGTIFHTHIFVYTGQKLVLSKGGGDIDHMQTRLVSLYKRNVEGENLGTRLGV